MSSDPLLSSSLQRREKMALSKPGTCLGGWVNVIGTIQRFVTIIDSRLQQYVNRELDFQAGFRKGRGTRDQIANIRWIVEKAREFQKNICFCFIDYAKAFDCVDHNKLWKILKEMGIPDHLICLLKNLYAG